MKKAVFLNSYYFSKFFLGIFVFLIVNPTTLSAQVSISTDNSEPDASAMVDVKSTERGFLPPRMNTIQREYINSPAEGLCIFNTDSLCLEFWDGSAWFDICSGNSYTPPIAVEGDCEVFWMDRNLGASQVAISSTDALAYGDLYQWGRLTDGHQIRTSATTTTLSNTDVPGHGNFIRPAISPYDWRSGQNDLLWQGASGINNPCPAGFRIPAETELECERASWATNNAAGAYVSPLKLPVAGLRSSSGGVLYGVGSGGGYWSSTVLGIRSRSLGLGSSASMVGSYRASGCSLRCLKD